MFNPKKLFALLSLTLMITASSALAQDTVTLTYWAQNVEHPQEIFDAFEAANPGIKVKQIAVSDFANKVRIALKAGGSDVPDVMQMPLDILPAFVLTGKILDLSPYVPSGYKDDFVPWVWSSVESDGKIYAIPQDSGPMAFAYRQDVFEEYGLSAPQTWEDYASAAVTLHEADANLYIGTVPNNGYTFTALLWQAGVTPFQTEGTSMKIDIASPTALKVAEYWDNLFATGALAANIDTGQAIAKGEIVADFQPAWAPIFFKPTAESSAGQWRISQMPQWEAGGTASANSGGSSQVATTYTQHPEEAAKLLMFMGSVEGQTIGYTKGLYPTSLTLLNDATTMGVTDDFYGGQAIYEEFAKASQGVDTSFEYPPFQDYVYSQMNIAFGSVVEGQTTFVQALKDLQADFVAYAKAQGFTVTE